MPDSDVRSALEELELFQGSDPAVLDRLAALAHPVSLTAGEYLFREGDAADRVSLLERGRLEAITRLPGGRELDVQPVGPGVLIGEMAVLSARPRNWSVRATQPCTGWSFDAAEVGLLGVSGQPEVARRLGRAALGRLREQYARLGSVRGDDPRYAGSARPSALDNAGPMRQVEREPDETAYLGTVLLFSRFTAAELDELFGDLRRLEAPRGATVIAAGESEPALFIVLRGALETTIRRGGLAARARLAGPGRVVGHLRLLDGEPTPATSRARERSIVLEVPRERVAEILGRGDDAGRRFALAVYTDVVDALVEAQRPISRMAAAGG